MTRAEALKSYTWNGAYAAKEETLKGSLAVGKLADITVLSKDIMTMPEDEIPSTDVVYTIVGGVVKTAAQPPGRGRCAAAGRAAAVARGVATSSVRRESHAATARPRVEPAAPRPPDFARH